MRNEALDPGFESGVLVTNGRAVVGSVTDLAHIVSDIDPDAANYGPVIDGDYSLQLKVNNASGLTNAALLSLAWVFDSDPGEIWSVAVQCGWVTPGLAGELSYVFTDPSGVNIGSIVDVSSTQDAVGWLAQEDLVAPGSAGGFKVLLRLAVGGSAGVDGSATFDNLTVVKDSVARLEPLDGDRGAMRWAGVPYASASYEIGDADRMAVMATWVPPYMIADPSTGEDS